MQKFKKILAIMLVVSLGTVVACGDDDDKGGKNNAANNTAINNSDSDTGNSESDTDNSESDTDNNESDTGNNEVEATTQLKDLSPAQLSTFCTQINTQESVIADPANEFGKANCLLEAAEIGYENGEDDADSLDICQEVQTECLADSLEITDVCMNPKDCSATVAEFEKCSIDYIAAVKALLSKVDGKTCADYSSEAGIEDLDEVMSTFVYPESCEALDTKCPNLYEAPEQDGE